MVNCRPHGELKINVPCTAFIVTPLVPLLFRER